jgi:hypothetical protein
MKYNTDRVFKEMNRLFKFDEKRNGWIVYKVINKKTPYSEEFEKKFGKPEAGKILMENNINTNIFVTCGAGINFGTKKWCIKNYNVRYLWICLVSIKNNTIIIPYSDFEKARARKVILLRKVRV